jgi:hypothetical protein
MTSDTPTPTWHTAADGDAATTRPAELTALGEHLGDCRARSGRLFRLHCGSEQLGGFVAAHLMTTLLALSLLLIAGIAWIG